MDTFIKVYSSATIRDFNATLRDCNIIIIIRIVVASWVHCVLCFALSSHLALSKNVQCEKVHISTAQRDATFRAIQNSDPPISSAHGSNEKACERK